MWFIIFLKNLFIHHEWRFMTNLWGALEIDKSALNLKLFCKIVEPSNFIVFAWTPLLDPSPARPPSLYLLAFAMHLFVFAIHMQCICLYLQFICNVFVIYLHTSLRSQSCKASLSATSVWYLFSTTCESHFYLISDLGQKICQELK